MGAGKKTDPLEIAVHVIIVLLGFIVLRFAYDFQDTFWQSLFVNIGSSLVIVTILFAIFESFRRRHEEREPHQLPNNNPLRNQQPHSDSRADELIITLRASQRPPITTKMNKLGN
jgi:hypothetical protein